MSRYQKSEVTGQKSDGGRGGREIEEKGHRSGQGGRCEVSIVIPAYNEEHRIGASLDRLVEYCRAHLPGHEIICVDDGSEDRTWKRITEPERGTSLRGIRLTRNRGKGYAVKQGMLAATGRYRFFTDADLPYRMDSFHGAMQVFENSDCELVVGSRDLPGASAGLKRGIFRHLAGRLFSAMVSRLVNIGPYDTQCGFKGFTAHAAEEIFSRLSVCGYAFDVEIFVLAHSLDLKICQIPVTLVSHAGSSVRLTSAPFRMLAELAKITWRERAGSREQGA
ncbi:MAG: glycosyltransferase family 2 protein [Deltaproteobacteria bacterium]|nr:glycosyltransferase family 2 protein [Deltaproteobacteria bacterium]